MPNPHRLGVAHLTALDLAPPDLVTTAAEAGFEFVGLRVATANDQELRWPLDVGSPMLLETVRRLQDSGLAVLDVESISLKPETRPSDYERALELGVRLGARFLNVLCDDPDLDRAADRFSELVERAKIYEIRPALEAMSYKHVSSLADAARIAQRSNGGGVLVDSLHLQRCGDTVEDVRSLDPGLLTHVQISDAPRAAATVRAAPAPLPRNQMCADVPDQVESLTARSAPGTGELPLLALLDALPHDLPVSVEAPNVEQIRSLGDQRFLRRQHDAARTLLRSTMDEQCSA
jgi:sugar phosphate isomerase/epimerase